MIDALQGPGSAMLQLALDAAALRHQAIAQNIANLHSADYVPLKVDFEARLAAARRPTLVAEQGVAPGPRPQDVDTELLKLSQNAIHYQALLRALGKQLAILGDAIDARRS
jgi:flagellar basal-body rod protein FlgB